MQIHSLEKNPLHLAVLAALTVLASLSTSTLAAGLEPDGEKNAGVGSNPAPIQEVIVKSKQSNLPSNLPNTIESIDAKQIAENINAITSAEALNYLPSAHVRERYIGDRNGILVLRVNSSVSSAQTAVYADNLLLSNFLNNSFSTAPRWGLVSPEEIERVDVLYGPFSALYPGNSAGGVVLISTHMPKKFAVHGKFDLFGQRFRQYGTDNTFNGGHAALSIGDKVGAWSYLLSVDKLDNSGQPQTFGAATRATVTGAPAFTNVSGELRDIDTSGNPRIITSSIGADHVNQTQGKVKLAYEISPTLRASYTLGWWENSSTTSVANYLQDAQGRPVYNTTSTGATRYVKFAGDAAYYTLAGTAPGAAESEHFLHGFSLKSNSRDAFNWEAIGSIYNQNKDLSRAASNTGSLYDSGTTLPRPSGNLTKADGTGWATIDLRGDLRLPLPHSATDKFNHKLSFGAHIDRYTLKSATYAVPSDWLNGAPSSSASSNSYGKTQTSALYLQDAWQIDTAWLLVVGGRLEHWKAFDGSNFNASNVPAYRQLNYANRSSSDFSPKVSLAFQADKDWNLRAAFGTGVRYPTVAEIFQTINLPNNVRQNDPNLAPEKVHSTELVAERLLPKGLARVSLFWEDKRDALISQTDTTVIPTISSIQNVDKLRTYGVEAVLNLRDILLAGLDINSSVTFTDSTILANRRNPGLVGTDQPRIPDLRATLVATYHVNDQLSASVSYRYSGRQHNALFNTVAGRYNDVNPNVYGAVSHYSVVDAKLLYRISAHWAAALGVNNIGAFKYYVNPNPYPQRTYFASLRFDY